MITSTWLLRTQTNTFTNTYENETQTDLTRGKFADNTYELNSGSSLQFFYLYLFLVFFGLVSSILIAFSHHLYPIPAYTNIQFNPIPYIMTTHTSIYARCLYYFGLASLFLFYSSFEPATDEGRDLINCIFVSCTS